MLTRVTEMPHSRAASVLFATARIWRPIDDVRRKTMLALEALLDFESWARMRELYGLSFDQASGVWMKAIDRLLPPTPAAT